MIAVFQRGGGRRRSRLGRHRRRSAVVRYHIDHQTPDGPSNIRSNVQSAAAAAMPPNLFKIEVGRDRMIAVFRREGGRRRSRLGRHRRRSAAVRYQIDHQTPDTGV